MGDAGAAEPAWKFWVAVFGVIGTLVAALTGVAKLVIETRSSAIAAETSKSGTVASAVAVPRSPTAANSETRSAIATRSEKCAEGYFLQTASGYQPGHTFEQTRKMVAGKPQLARACFVEVATPSGEPVFGVLADSPAQASIVGDVVRSFGGKPASQASFVEHPAIIRRLFWIDDHGIARRDW